MNGPETGLGNRHREDNRRKIIIRFSIVISALVILLVSSILSYNYVMTSNANLNKNEPIIIDPEKSVEVEIPLGSNTAAIAKILKEKGLVKNSFIFKMMSKLNGYDGTYKSGTHILSTELDYDKIMRVLSSNPVSVKVTIPEGFTFKQISDRYIKNKLITREQFLSTANNENLEYTFIKDLPKRDPRLEGYLFPDTYEFDLRAGEKEIIKKMLDRFEVIFKSEYYKQIDTLNKELKLTEKNKMTVDRIITLASIIEKEAQDSDERRIIAGVFYNRIKNKEKAIRKLQSCATVQYIYLNRLVDVTEEDKSRVAKGIILDKDTELDDPYNTYKYEGLPPGPICNPGKAAIEAVLDPEIHDYLYFVAKGDGTHIFSKTLKEHEAAKKSVK